MAMVLEEEEEVEEVEVPTPIEEEVVKPPRLLPLQAPNKMSGLLPEVLVGGCLQFSQTCWSHQTSNTWVQEIVFHSYTLDFIQPHSPLVQGTL